MNSVTQLQFTANADKYVRSADHAAGASLTRLLEMVRSWPEGPALDVATGGGHTALALAPLVRSVVASDLTGAMLAAARRFAAASAVTNLTFVQNDAGALPFPQAAFRLVTCRLAAHHFPDCALFTREMARVLCPGGLAAVIDNITPADAAAARFINAFETLRDPGHHWEYAVPDWEAFFIAAGLQIVHIETFDKIMDFDRYCERMSVPAHIRLQLRALLWHAPAAARQALAPSFSADPLTGPLTFRLGEILIVGQKAAT